jgi:hypothetical protein
VCIEVLGRLPQPLRVYERGLRELTSVDSIDIFKTKILFIDEKSNVCVILIATATRPADGCLFYK